MPGFLKNENQNLFVKNKKNLTYVQGSLEILGFLAAETRGKYGFTVSQQCRCLRLFESLSGQLKGQRNFLVFARFIAGIIQCIHIYNFHIFLLSPAVISLLASN